MKYGYATCQPHKGGGVPLSALPKDTTSELAGLSKVLVIIATSNTSNNNNVDFTSHLSTKIVTKSQSKRITNALNN